MQDFYEEKAKYRKKKDSSKSKSSVKTKHKHRYEKCILECGKHSYFTIVDYCTVCGKIGKTYVDDICEKLPNGSYRHYSNDEILDKNKKLVKFYVEDTLYDKYVGI